METTANNKCAAQMTINLTDISLANDVKHLLRHLQGVESITVHRVKSELDLAIEESESGKVTRWESVYKGRRETSGRSAYRSAMGVEGFRR